MPSGVTEGPLAYAGDLTGSGSDERLASGTGSARCADRGGTGLYAAGKGVGGLVPAVDRWRSILRPGDRVCLEGDNRSRPIASPGSLAVDPAGSTNCTWCSPALACGSTSTSSSAARRGGSTMRIGPEWAGSHACCSAARSPSVLLKPTSSCSPLFHRPDAERAPIAGASADRDATFIPARTSRTCRPSWRHCLQEWVVVAQVNEIVDRVPRVEIPADRDRLRGRGGQAFYVEPLFTATRLR